MRGGAARSWSPGGDQHPGDLGRDVGHWGWGARRFTDHVVVVGLGGRGLRTAQPWPRGDVLAIELDPDEPHVREARRLGIPVLIGDGADAARLRSARIDRARRMIVLVGDAEQGAAIADAVAALASEDPLKDEFCCYVSVTDAVAVREINGLLARPGAARPARVLQSRGTRRDRDLRPMGPVAGR